MITGMLAKRLRNTLNMSRIAAPLGDVITPIQCGKVGMAFL